MNTTATPFPPAQRDSMEALRQELTRRTQRAITVEYGETDCGQGWAAVCVESWPRYVEGGLEPLVSVFTGTNVDGEAVLMGSQGNELAPAGDFADVVASARFAAVRQYRAKLQVVHA